MQDMLRVTEILIGTEEVGSEREPQCYAIASVGQDRSLLKRSMQGMVRSNNINRKDWSYTQAARATVEVNETEMG